MQTTKSSASWSKPAFLKRLKREGVTFQGLDPSFFSQNTVEVAKELLGKILIVTHAKDPLRVVRIVETEAYSGVAPDGDPASHSYRGRTPRSAPMFEESGRAYIYFIYGMYKMLNFVTERAGHPGAVLIRGVDPVWGFEGIEAENLRGPGRLAKTLGITLKDNRASLFGPRFWVGEDDFAPGNIVATPRIGIRHGQERLWRFYLKGHLGVSR